MDTSTETQKIDNLADGIIMDVSDNSEIPSHFAMPSDDDVAAQPRVELANTSLEANTEIQIQNLADELIMGESSPSEIPSHFAIPSDHEVSAQPRLEVEQGAIGGGTEQEHSGSGYEFDSSQDKLPDIDMEANTQPEPHAAPEAPVGSEPTPADNSPSQKMGDFAGSVLDEESKSSEDKAVLDDNEERLKEISGMHPDSEILVGLLLNYYNTRPDQDKVSKPLSDHFSDFVRTQNCVRHLESNEGDQAIVDAIGTKLKVDESSKTTKNEVDFSTDDGVKKNDKAKPDQESVDSKDAAVQTAQAIANKENSPVAQQVMPGPGGGSGGAAAAITALSRAPVDMVRQALQLARDVAVSAGKGAKNIAANSANKATQMRDNIDIKEWQDNIQTADEKIEKFSDLAEKIGNFKESMPTPERNKMVKDLNDAKDDVLESINREAKSSANQVKRGKMKPEKMSSTFNDRHEQMDEIFSKLLDSDGVKNNPDLKKDVEESKNDFFKKIQEMAKDLMNMVKSLFNRAGPSPTPN